MDTSSYSLAVKATFPSEGPISDYIKLEGATLGEGKSDNYPRTAVVTPEKGNGSVEIDVQKCLEGEKKNLAAGRYIAIGIKCKNKGTEIDLTGVDTGLTGTHKYLNSAFTEGGMREEGVLFDTIFTLRVSGYLTKIRFNFYSEGLAPFEILGAVCSDNLNDALKICGREDLCLTDPEFVYEDPLKDKILKAENEDPEISLWFEHATTKRIITDRIHSGMYGYTVNMSKNEKEGCQFFIFPGIKDRSFDVTVDPFVSESGKTVDHALHFEYYHNINHCLIADGLPLVEKSVNVKGGNSQGFFIKLTTTADTEPGDYFSTVHVRDAETGKEVKRAAVGLHVFNVTLSDETYLNTAFAIWADRISKTSKEKYNLYYEWFLENRINVMDLAYGVTPGESEKYLSDPRVNTVRTYDSKFEEKFPEKPAWANKIIFYPTEADEPREDVHFKILREQSEKIRESIPDARIIMPFERNLYLTEDGKITTRENSATDSIGFMSRYINLWCPLFQSSFTTRDLGFITGATYLQDEYQDEKYGDFLDRMKSETDEGDELWAYKTLAPNPAYTNFFLTSNGSDGIVTMWQCKEFGITGFLYWGVNVWKVNYWDNTRPWEMANSWGDGMLVYDGFLFNSDLPISTMRLEAIREGIEDYQHLCMLEKAAGKEESDRFVSMVTTSILTFTADDGYLRNVRVLLRKTLEKELNK